MCNGYGCPSKLPSGNCGHKGHGPMFCSFDDPEEYEEAIANYEDAKAEHEWDNMMDRKYGL